MECWKMSTLIGNEQINFSITPLIQYSITPIYDVRAIAHCKAKFILGSCERTDSYFL